MIGLVLRRGGSVGGGLVMWHDRDGAMTID